MLALAILAMAAPAKALATDTTAPDVQVSGGLANYNDRYRSPGAYPDKFDYAHSWAVAAISHDHFLQYHLGRTLGPNDVLRPGDIIYYAWSDPNDETWDHAAIVTRVTKHQVFVAQHGKDYEHSMGYQVNRPGGLQDTHPDYLLEFVRPTLTKANVPY